VCPGGNNFNSITGRPSSVALASSVACLAPRSLHHRLRFDDGSGTPALSLPRYGALTSATHCQLRSYVDIIIVIIKNIIETLHSLIYKNNWINFDCEESLGRKLSYIFIYSTFVCQNTPHFNI